MTATSTSAATPRSVSTRRPAAQDRAEFVGQVLAAGAEFGRGSAEERGQRGGPDPAGSVRLLQGLQQRPASPRRAGVAYTLPAPAIDRRNAHCRKGFPHQARSARGCRPARRRHRRRGPGRRMSGARASSAAMSAARSRATSDARPCACRSCSRGPTPDLVAADHPQPQRRRRRGADQPGLRHASRRTGRTTISGSPSSAPPINDSNAATSGASLRQLSASVDLVPAVRAAAR